MLQDIKNKLKQMDTAFFIIDGQPYALSLRDGQEGNCDDISVLALFITDKYFNPMMELAKKEAWDAVDEQDAAQFGNHILLTLGEYNCTPDKTNRILNGFNESQLAQLGHQLDVYGRIRPLYCKYKIRELA